jgi:hypothetical protein
VTSEFLHGCKTWYPTLRDEHNWVYATILCSGFYIGQTGSRLMENGEDCVARKFIICTYQVIFGWSNQGGWDGRSMWHLCMGRREMCSVFWWGKLKKKHCSLERSKLRWESNITVDISKTNGTTWNGLIFFKIATSFVLLLALWWTFRLYKCGKFRHYLRNSLTFHQVLFHEFDWLVS